MPDRNLLKRDHTAVISNSTSIDVLTYCAVGRHPALFTSSIRASDMHYYHCALQPPADTHRPQHFYYFRQRLVVLIRLSVLITSASD